MRDAINWPEVWNVSACALLVLAVVFVAGVGAVVSVAGWMGI